MRREARHQRCIYNSNGSREERTKPQQQGGRTLFTAVEYSYTTSTVQLPVDKL